MTEKATPETRETQPVQRQANRPARFEAPAQLPAKFGVQAMAEDHIEGIVETSEVRALLDAFGLHERKSIVFPFQHIKKAHGEIWRMYIDVIAAHTVKGEVLMGHRWIYQRTLPESSGAQV